MPFIKLESEFLPNIKYIIFVFLIASITILPTHADAIGICKLALGFHISHAQEEMFFSIVAADGKYTERDFWESFDMAEPNLTREQKDIIFARIFDFIMANDTTEQPWQLRQAAKLAEQSYMALPNAYNSLEDAVEALRKACKTMGSPDCTFPHLPVVK